LVAAHPWRSDTRGTAAAPTATRPVYTCQVERKDGVLYAGNSTTRDAILQQGMVGPDVAEAQCLLRNAGFSPGDVDGVYRDVTERAVRRVQQKAHLVVDGKVGPHTWGELRGGRPPINSPRN